jgi:hypothetical protein|tara:strand:+ start:2129 stop:2593 length:465 start_codon:yes stop_codon:yes gene_type:complete
MAIETQWDISGIKNSNEVCYKTRSADGVFIKDKDDNFIMRQRSLMIIDATKDVHMNKITKKNCKEFYRRLKVLQIVGFTPIENLRLNDIQEHIGLSTNAETLTYKAFKLMVFKAMEDGADLIIKAEKEMPTPIIADSSEKAESEEEEVTLVPDL